jgi:hypothetical protein
VVGWRLYRHQSLLRPTLDLAITLPLVLILASTLFYDCRPCLLPAPWQLPATSLLSLLLLGALLFRPARTTGKNAQQEY